MNRLRRQLVSWSKVLVSQAVVIALLWALGDLLPRGGHMVVVPLLLLQGLAAALIGRFLGLSAFWIPIQFLIPFALVYGGGVPAWAYLLAFGTIALMFWNSPGERVPLYLTNASTRTALGDLITKSGARTMIDLGCGTGGLAVGLARSHPELRVTGVETAPPVFAIAWLNAALRGRSRTRIRFENLWKVNLAGHDLVYCFLSPAPMEKLHEKACREMTAGALLVSNSFAIPGIPPEQVIEVGDRRKTRLFVYRPGAS